LAVDDSFTGDRLLGFWWSAAALLRGLGGLGFFPADLGYAVPTGLSSSYNLPMIVWDEPKRRENLRKHGIDLADCEVLFDAPLATTEDDREAYGE
jgi:hypothetical protein